MIVSIVCMVVSFSFIAHGLIVRYGERRYWDGYFDHESRMDEEMEIAEHRHEVEKN